MVEPIILPDCGHTFCNDCVTKIRENQDGPRHCPNCRTPIRGDLQTNFALKTMVAKIRTRCNRCQNEDDLAALSRHQCPEEQMTCSNEGCNLKFKRRHKDTHAEECLYKVIFCSLCHHRTTVMDEDVHLEQCCPEGKTTCPFKCKLRVKRYEFKKLLFDNYLLWSH